MYTVKRMPEFDVWFNRLPDLATRIRLARRLDKAALGNLGDVKPVGEGVFEMREFFGSGWRMYYVQHQGMLIVMLGGGNKARQNADIAAAKKLAATIAVPTPEE